jgi:hypothetical protein
MIASQSRKSARRARHLSIGRREARSNIRLSLQTVRQFAELNVIRSSFISRLTVEQLLASARFKSAGSPAAPKSP